MKENNSISQNIESTQGNNGSTNASRELIRDYVQVTFANPLKRASLISILKAKNIEDLDDFYQNVSDYLALMPNIVNGPFANISEKDIREIGLLEIRNTILRESIGIENQTYSILHKIFNEWEESSFTDEQKILLKDSLMYESAFSLKTLMRSRNARGNFINQKIINTNNIVSVDFDRVCGDIAIQNPNVEQKRIIQNWMNGFSVTEKDISVLLSGLNESSIEDKRKILQYFIPVISVGFLLQNNILSKNTVKTIILNQIQDIDNSLVEDDIDTLSEGVLNGILSGDIAFNLKTSYLSEIDIDNLWNNTNLRSSLSEIIESDLVITTTYDNPLELSKDSNGKLHSGFLRKLHQIFLNRRSGNLQINGIDKFIKGSVIQIKDDTTGTTDYIQVVDTDVLNEDDQEGMLFQLIAKNDRILNNASVEWRNYQDVPNIFHGAHKLGNKVTILSQSEFDDEITSGSIIPDMENNDDLTEKSTQMYLDELDPQGKDYGFQKGTMFHMIDENNGETSIIEIDQINSSSKLISLKEGGNSIGSLTFALFLELCKSFKLKRVPSIHNAEDFLKHVDITGLVYKENEGLRIKGSNHHDDHHHGHTDHHTSDYILPKAITTSDGKGHILIKNSTNDSIVFTEYKGNKAWKDLSDDQKKDIEKGEYKGSRNIYTKPIEMDYASFAVYIKKAKLAKVIAEDPLKDNDSYTEEMPFHHMHNSRLKAFLGMKNLGELFKAFEMSWHAFEHTMEKGQKINAAKLMYKMFGGIDGDFGAQIVADYVESVGETIDKIKKKINGFNNGLKKRKKCLHLIQDYASKPEEIAAALMVTVEGSGGLYMDEPFVGYAGSWMWFNSLVRAAGYSNPRSIKEDLTPKVRAVNAENPTEEMYIEQFLKIYGEKEQNPLLMAMGGYPKFRKALIEGRKGEIEKGERDANELLGVGDKVQTGINKMTTGEYPQVLGIYKAAMGQYAGGPADVIPWMWALSGATKIVHPNVAKEFKNFTDAHGFTFHAISFCRNPELSDIYKRVVRKIVAAKLPKTVLDQFDEIQTSVDHQFSGHHHRTEKELDDYNKKKIMLPLQQFWTNHKDIIHPILQGTSDSFLFENMDDPDIRAYVKNLDETHNYRGSGGKDGFNRDYGFVDGYKDSPSFGFSEVQIGDKKIVARDIKRQLDWIRIHGQNAGSIENELDTYIFQKSILPFLKNDIRNITNPEQQKATYIANYRAIVSWIREYLGGYDGKKGQYLGVLGQRYMRDLIGLGYDLSFETVIENNINQNNTIRDEIDRQAAEDSYARFKNKHAWSALGEVADTKSKIDYLSNASNDSHFSTRQAA